LGVIFFAVIMVIIVMGAKDYMRFVWQYFFKTFAVAAALSVLGWLLFFYPQKKAAQSKAFRCVCLALAVLAACLYLTGFSLNRISCSVKSP
ncbi:MAG: hypothetical protein IJM49_05690, partial [Firmicutes bacterium]|nr:hypothetical protein [Bacillota bacterium]